MNKIFRLVILCSAIGLLTACGNNTNQAASDVVGKQTAVNTTLALAPIAVDAYRPEASTTASQQNSPMKARNLSVAPIASQIFLVAPPSSVVTAAQATPIQAGQPIQESFGRPSTQTSTTAATAQLLKWQKSPAGGQIAAISFTSASAKGLRVGLLVNQLPASATLRYYSQGDLTAYEVTGPDVLVLLAKNAAAGDTSDAGRTYWSPLLESAEMTLEIELPAGASTSELAVAVPTLMHSFRSSSEIQAQAVATLPSVCNVDINCLSTKPAVSNAVVVLSFITGANTGYKCTGTMLNNSQNDGTAYLLTSNRCISSQTSASSVFPSIFVLSNSCNSPNSSGQGLATGATLLFSSYNSDSTLVRLTANVSQYFGSYFAGWDASTPPPVGLAVDTIHHPNYSTQRIASGSIDQYFTRAAGGSWVSSNITNSTFVGATLTSGVVEDGSYGAALFKNITTNPQVIGQLSDLAAASCLTPTTSSPQTAKFGRFDVAFNAGMSDWLSLGRKPVYRFYNTGNGSHFYSVSLTEKNYVKASIAQYLYEGPSFQADTVKTASTSPVYRFYNATTRAHFYTISESEKADVIAKLPQFAYEGISWYAKTPAQILATPDATTVPLFRFYNLSNGTHFYTNSESEKANVIATLSKTYQYEGPAYYVWP